MENIGTKVAIFRVEKFEKKKEDDIKHRVAIHVNNALKSGLPISSKDVPSWLYRHEKIDIQKSSLHNWEITWKRLKKEEYRREKEYVIEQRFLCLKEMNKELKV